jgi:hypothetical protein
MSTIIKRSKVLCTVTRLAVQRVHIQHDIIDSVHRIDGWRIVAVTEGVCQLASTSLVLITSFFHEVVNKQTYLEDV